ncbi:Protein tyrosine phosphatase type IVA 1 [Labeo rohita]|uniref:Protein tyrosine phosphatase type IVA 1 n=1 Tax=Labeo rohita TaxID=84645 RepID=A0ABQ8M915_LABRO|nr:Protein tyrosine phosphatase type IVA 1 [Labeo rohita]
MQRSERLASLPHQKRDLCYSFNVGGIGLGERASTAVGGSGWGKKNLLKFTALVGPTSSLSPENQPCFLGFLFSIFLIFLGSKMARMNRPAPVEITYKNMRFLITHNPTNATLHKFIEELKKYGVTTVVRVCEATYDANLVVKEGIQVLDWPFDDGAPPSNQIVDDWLNLLRVKFREEPGCCIAVHCVAGLGRAPVLVALALIEKRRGAFNSKQLFYLEKYRPKMRLRFKDSNGHRNNCCIQ